MMGSTPFCDMHLSECLIFSQSITLFILRTCVFNNYSISLSDKILLKKLCFLSCCHHFIILERQTMTYSHQEQLDVS